MQQNTYLYAGMMSITVNTFILFLFHYFIFIHIIFHSVCTTFFAAVNIQISQSQSAEPGCHLSAGHPLKEKNIFTFCCPIKVNNSWPEVKKIKIKKQQILQFELLELSSCVSFAAIYKNSCCWVFFHERITRFTQQRRQRLEGRRRTFQLFIFFPFFL